MITYFGLGGGPSFLGYNFIGAMPSNKVQLVTGSWKSPPAHRSASLIGRDPYKEMVDGFAVSILGTSEDDCWNTYNQLAEDFQPMATLRQRPIGVSYLFQIQTKSGGPLWTTMVTGPADATTPIVGPPSDPVTDSTGLYMMQRIEFRFRRKGRWVNPSGGVAATSATHEIGKKVTITFGAAQICDSPVDVKWTDQTNPGPAGFINDGLVIIANHDAGASAIVEVDGQNIGAAAGMFGTVNDSANTPASSGSVVKTFVPTTNVVQIAQNTAGIVTPHQRNLVLATVKGITANAVGVIMCQIMNNADLTSTWASENRPVYGTNTATVLNLGVISLPYNINLSNLIIRMFFQNLSTTLGTIYLDRLYFINLDLPNLTIFYHGGLFKQSGSLATHTLDQRYYSALSPEFYGSGNLTAGRPLGSLHASMKNAQMTALWLTPTGTQWRWCYTATTTPRSLQATATVLPASVYPRAS